MRNSYALSLTAVILLLTIELSFTQSVLLNLWVVAASLLFLLWKRRYAGCVAVFLLPAIPALATYWSVAVQGSGKGDALVLATRAVAFAAMGIVFALGIDLEELFLVLEQKGLPANFVYGLLVVVHALPTIKQEVVDLREAALFKGKRLHFWSPLLYFKTILVAFDWQQAYTEAMYAHGYDENGPRQQYLRYRESPSAVSLLLLFFISCNAALLFSR